MLELLMVMDEEVVMGDYAGCINDFNVNLPADTSVSPAGSDAVSFIHQKSHVWTLTEVCSD